MSAIKRAKGKGLGCDEFEVLTLVTMTGPGVNGGFKASYRLLQRESSDQGDISSDTPDANEASHEVITSASARSDLTSIPSQIALNCLWGCEAS